MSTLCANGVCWTSHRPKGGSPPMCACVRVQSMSFCFVESSMSAFDFCYNTTNGANPIWNVGKFKLRTNLVFIFVIFFRETQNLLNWKKKYSNIPTEHVWVQRAFASPQFPLLFQHIYVTWKGIVAISIPQADGRCLQAIEYSCRHGRCADHAWWQPAHSESWTRTNK